MSAGRILLTGASGFVGRHTIGPLIDLGFEVHAVGNTQVDERARWYRADLLDQTARRRLVASVRPYALLHCAWVTQHGAFWGAPANLDWVAASLDLARAAAEQGAARMLFTGSCAEYDWTNPPARLWREDDPCRPGTLYGVAKHSLHAILAPFADAAGIALVWARLFHLYGPHDAPGRLVPGILRALREGARVETGPAETVRDWLHVEDAGRALAGLIANAPSGAYNVASGSPVSVGALAGIAARLAGRPDLLAVGAWQPTAAEPATIAADIGKLRGAGFAPSIVLQDGLAALWKGMPARPTPPPPALPRAVTYEEARDHYRAGRLEPAEAAVKALLARQPDHVPALNLLGVLRRRAGDPLRARASLERAASLDPNSETAWINLGNVHLDLEDAEAAVEAYSRGLAAAPSRTDTLRLLGNALCRSGRDAEAMARFDAALMATPGSTVVLRDRARAHFAAGRFEAALADVETALRDTPQDKEMLLVRAQMRRLSGHAAAAMTELRALVAASPDNADAHLALADALLAQEKREDANEHYRRAAALRPDDELPLGKLCWCLLNSRHGEEAAHVAEAAAIARRLVSRGVLQPANAHAVQSALMRVADLDGMAAFDALFPDRRVLLDFWVRRNVIGALHAQLGRVRTEEDRLVLVDRHRQWGTRYESRVTPLRPHRGPVGSRIRVGFVSSDLRHHPVTYFALPIFEAYDRDRFELFAYSFHPGAPDAVQKRIAGQVSAFRRMPNQPEQAIAQRIADDGLDILFELGGSTHLNRLEVMAHQPAPVQVSWLGYPHSSGLGRIGHILVDPYLRPPDPRLLIEQPFEMPSSWVSLSRLGFGDFPIRPGLPEERNGHITFGTMNNPYKYAPEAFALWAAVMRRVPGSRFLFVRPECGTATFRENVARAFARHGIGADRIDHRAVRGKHMAHYNDIDIALDTAPQTGGTTTCECLWMGVPTVSLVGPAFFERLSFSNLVNAGLRDLAADSPAAYVDAAVALVADAPRRRALRTGLRADIRASALGDTTRWVRDFEAVILRTLGVGETVVLAPDPTLSA
jgi:predicted O-linked N-acetylglucosamine transferase (SPINDLY family)/nucleoside-diphosphate-sugar epimerase